MKLKQVISRPLTTIIFLCSISHNINATDYSAGFDFDLRGTHDNNIRLTQADKTAVSGFVAIPALLLSAETETAKIALDSKFNFYRYNDSGFNTDNQDVNLSSSMQFERNIIGVNAGLLRDSTTQSELLDSGRIGTKAERSEKHSLSPFWIFKVNEKNALTFRSAYSIRNYQSHSYTGSKTWDSSVDWTSQLSQRWTLDLIALYSRYDYDRVSLSVPTNDTAISILGSIIVIPEGSLGEQSYESQNTTKGGQIGITYSLSESAELSGLLGRSQSRSSYSVSDEDYYCGSDFRRNFAPLCALQSNTGSITTAVINWKWKGENQEVQANLTKSQQPSSNSYVFDATVISLDWNYRLSELDRFSISISGTRNREIGSNNFQQTINQINRDYVSAELGYHRQISESWYVDTSYQYRYQEYKDFDYRANSNVISLGVSYHPVPKHWSR